MNSKSMLVALVASVTLAATAAAGPGGKRDMYPQKMLEKMTEKLGLYDDQVPQVEAILQEAADKRRQIGDTYTLNQRDEARQAMRALREETDARLADILTEEQQARLEAHRAERRDRMRERRLRRSERRDSIPEPETL